MPASTSGPNRWGIALAGFFMQVALGAVYAWSVFKAPLSRQFHWSTPDVTLTFTICIFVVGFAAFFAGLWLKKTSPRTVALTGGFLYGLGVFLASFSANRLWWLYLSYGLIGGVGLGFGYIVPVAVLVKWFPDRRGLAVGLTAAGYGAGTALTVIPIQYVIASYGYQSAFLWFGIVQGAVVFALAWLLRGPEPGETANAPPAKVAQSSRSYTPAQVLWTPVFWLLYIMFIMVSASGLMATAQLAPIAKDFNVSSVIILAGLSTLSLAAIIDNICNGGARPLFGWISDNIGREYTMALAFGLGGFAYWLLGTLGHQPWGFVIFAALIDRKSVV